jgi:hypothetical protein
VSWRTFAGCFTDGRLADAKLASSKDEIRHYARLEIASGHTPRASSRWSIFRIMKATGRFRGAETAEP